VSERRIKLRVQGQRVQQFTDPSHSFGLAFGLVELTGVLESSGQPVMGPPVLGKIDQGGSERGDGLIRAVVMLEVPAASQPPEPAVTTQSWPGLQERPPTVRLSSIGEPSHQSLPNRDMFVMPIQ
jgi:hypothetical protein